MKRFPLLLLTALACCVLLADLATACPNCNDIMASNWEEGNDPLKEARAYNTSILFMLTMPYLLLGCLGLLLYGKYRQGLAYQEPPAERQAGATDDSGSQGPG